jgi:diguanylate cyclase (GGDEF)-like protein
VATEPLLTNGGSGTKRRSRAFGGVLAMVAAVVSAQQPALRVYGIRDGLKFPQIFAVMQDSRGLLWVGTSYGVSRYDGREFRSLTKSDGLPHDSVRALAEDGAGTIWVLTKQGVARIAALGGPLGAPEVLLPPPALEPLKVRVLKGMVAHAAALWLLGDSDVLRFEGGTLDQIPLPAADREETVSIGPADADGVWVCTTGHVVRLQDREPPRTLACPPVLGPAVALVRVGDGVLLIQKRGIARLAVDRIEPEPGWGLPLDANPTGGIALGSKLVVLTPARGALLLERGSPLRPLTMGEGLPSDAVYGAAVDREGLLWLATSNGLVKVFDLALWSYPSRAGELGAMVLAFARDARGGLWVGHSEGATLIRGGKKESHDTRRQPSEEAGVWALLPVPGGGALAGTRHGVVLLRDRRVVHLSDLPLAGRDRVFSLARDGEGWVWASTTQGIVRFRWDDIRERVSGARAFTHVDGSPLGEVRGISPAADGKVWFGTDGAGVALWDGSAMHRFGREAGLPSVVCRAVLSRPEGVWVGTDVGLWLLSGGDATEVDSVNLALSDRYVVAMAPGGDGSVWLATPYEVVKVVDDEVVASIDQALGLVGASTTAENCLAAGTGEPLLVGTVGGFTEVPQDLDRRPRSEPAVLLLGAEDRAGHPVQAGATVPYRLNTLTFAYASPSFLAEQDTFFQERLVGYDPMWSEPHPYLNQRTANLPAGKYVFEARAVDRGGVTSPTPARFAFSVASPWWQTFPALLGFVLAVGLLAYGIALLRTMRIRRRNEELEGVVRERTRQLAEANEALERLATTDGLTGIANHRVFQDRLAHEWARAERDGSPLSLLMIDVDAFKAYNDGLGHQAGDSCLRQVAQVVADHATRPGDLAARYGGEEFAVILAGTDDGGARAVADKLRAAVEALAVPHPGSPVAPAVTVSIGLATARPVLGGAPAMLVAAADGGLYRAKRSGRNRVCAGSSMTGAPAGSDGRR